MRTSPRPENGAAGSTHCPQRAGPGRARPGALGARGSGLRAPVHGATTARSGGRRATGTGAALTVAFVSAARFGRSRSRRRLRGSCLPNPRSCAPRRTRRFLAPPSPPRLARRRGGGRGSLREPRRGPRSTRRAGPAPWPRGTRTLPRAPDPAPHRALGLRGLGSPLRR